MGLLPTFWTVPWQYTQSPLLIQLNSVMIGGAPVGSAVGVGVKVGVAVGVFVTNGLTMMGK